MVQGTGISASFKKITRVSFFVIFCNRRSKVPSPHTPPRTSHAVGPWTQVKYGASYLVRACVCVSPPVMSHRRCTTRRTVQPHLALIFASSPSLKG